MKIFFCWSGESSHKISLLFDDFLKAIFPFIETFISSENIANGLMWNDILKKELKNCSIGILFITKQNINSPWINFEAGALSNSFVNSRVIPFLFGVEKSDIRFPLAMFQSCDANKDEIQKFFMSINNYSEEPMIKESILIKNFESFWPNWENKLVILLDSLISENAKKIGDDIRVPTDSIEIKTYMLEYFKKKISMKGLYQKILTLDYINGKMMWIEEEEWILKASELLEEFENKNWIDRKFRILYGQFVTKPISILEYINACILVDPPVLYYTIKNIFNRFSKSCVSLMSVRDIFEDYDGKLVEDNKEYFEKSGLIDGNFPHPSERDKLIHASNPPTVNYKGIIPDFLDRNDIHYLFEKMDELRKNAKKMIDYEATVSLSHIVLSHFHLCNEKPVMLITASNTFKDRLKIFSEIPIIIKEDDFYFYGESTNKPSTEAITHWIIHSSMLKNKKDRYASIIHIHNETMTTIAEKSEKLELETAIIPTIPHYDYGTEDLGERIFNAFNINNTFGVTVRAHGQWFIGDTFEGLSRDIKKILHEVEKKKAIYGVKP